MSEKDRKYYQSVKSDPIKYAAFLEAKRRQRASRQSLNRYETIRKRAWRAKNPEAKERIRRANHAVEYALKSGKLVKPKRCEKCGKERPLQGHHPSYAETQWLVVQWLCQACHSAEHYPQSSETTL